MSWERILIVNLKYCYFRFLRSESHLKKFKDKIFIKIPYNILCRTIVALTVNLHDMAVSFEC